MESREDWLTEENIKKDAVIRAAVKLHAWVEDLMSGDPGLAATEGALCVDEFEAAMTRLKGV